jgi:iron complex outermembrane receptor protein
MITTTNHTEGNRTAGNPDPRGHAIMNAMKIRLSIAATCAALTFAAPVLAQDSDLAIEEIVVTATRVETNLMTTSIAVSAFDQDTLDKNGVKDIRDAAALVPNFDVTFSPVDSGVQMTMRGINSNNFTEIGDPSVAFHVDGIYSPRPQGATALMFDLERLEVMRGPQGTLFGRNSAAGSVNVISAKPSVEGVFGTLAAEVGNRNQQLLLGTLNVPLGDTFAIRANFLGETRDGFAEQGSGTKDLQGIGNQPPDSIPDMDQRRNYAVSKSDAYGNADRWAARLSAMWFPSDRLDLRLTVETAQDKNAGWPIAPNCEANPEICQYNGGGIDYVDPNVPGYLDMTNDAVRANVNFALTDNIDIVYNFGYAQQKRDQNYDADMGWRAVPGPNTGWNNRYQPWQSLHFFTEDADYKSSSHELQFQGETGSVNWIVGLFNLQEDNSITFDVELPFCCRFGSLGGASFIQPERTLESNAIFGQATWHFSDRWHFTAGYRYYKDTKEDVGGRNYGCFGGGNCSFSAGLVPFDGWPQSPSEEDELLLPQFTSADLGPGMGAQDRLNNYAITGQNDTKNSYEDGTWRIGVDFDLSDTSFIYTYVATGSKAGGFQDGVDVCECGRIEFFGYDPEEVTNYEIGYKATLWDGRMNLILTAFYTDYRNKQVSSFRTVGVAESPPGTPIVPVREIGAFVTQNAAAADITGFEVEWDVVPWESGRFTGGIGILKTEFKEWPGYAGETFFCDERDDAGPEFACIPPDVGNTGVNSPVGNELPYSTPVSLTAAYNHDFDFSGGSTLSTYFKFRWEDEMHMTEGNFDGLDTVSDKRDAYGTLDANIRYRTPSGAWLLEAFVYNATDERVQTYWVPDSRPGVPLFAWNAPRTYGVKATYSLQP